MARLIYSLTLYLAAPLIALRLLWRSRRQAGYRQHWRERWGFYRVSFGQPCIWVHAVSVGETRAAEPLIAALRLSYPAHHILLTAMTPTGRDTGRTVFGDQVTQVYLPYDFPGAMRRFLAHFRPEFGVLMETEIWPNLVRASARRAMPLFLVNARLSERSARGYARFSALTGPAFRALRGVAAQTDADAARLQALGAPRVEVCGNLKFDVELPADACALGEGWRAAIGTRPVWLAASTREGEEAAILAAWQARHPSTATGDALLVIVPRHPQRFDEIATQLARDGWAYARRSSALPTTSDQVWLGDSMGEMAAYYTLADLAFIGGSLQPLGGQNLIEAAAAGCPTLLGPHTFNFRQVAEAAIAIGAATRIEDADHLCATVQALLADADTRAQMKTAGLAFANTHRGASRKTLEFIGRLLDPAGR